MQKQQQSQSSYTTETQNNDEETPSVTKLWRQKADSTKATVIGRSKASGDTAATPSAHPRIKGHPSSLYTANVTTTPS